MAKSKKSLSEVGDTIPKEKPTLRLDESDYPDLKNCKVDDECVLTVKVKLQEVGRERWTNDKRLWGTFQILSVKGDTDDETTKGMKSAGYGSGFKRK